MRQTREERFEELFREHYGAVRGYALRRMPSDVAQDVVSETFLVAWRRLDDVPSDALPWLYGVARRVLANQRRSADRSAALEQRVAASAETIAAGSDLGEDLGDDEIGRAALGRLSDRDREALMLVAWHGLSGARAARAAGVHADRVRGAAASSARPARHRAGLAALGGCPDRQCRIGGGVLMPRHQDLMERLAAADPLRDRDEMTLQEQREADALLARLLATPVESEAKPRRLRRRALAVAGVACAAVAALAAIDLIDADTPGPGVIDKAVAAVTREGFVYHVVEFTTASESPPLENSEPSPPVLSESWYTSDGRLHRKAFVVPDGRKGRLAEDFAGWRPAGRRAGAALRFDGFTNTITESGFGRGDGSVPAIDSTQGPGEQLRALVEDGRLHVTGTTSVDGKRAYRLASGKINVDDDYEMEIEYTVDAQSYLPLARQLTTRQEGRTFDVRTRYRAYERLPLNGKTDRLLALDPHPKAKCSEFAHELTEERDLGFPNPCGSG